MELSRIWAIIVFLLFMSDAQSQLVKSERHTNKELNESIHSFSEASDFFFTTLGENFKGDRGESMIALMKVLAKDRDEPEDFFRLNIDPHEFNELNTSLDSIYDYFFPIHIYKKGSGTKDYVVQKRIENEKCDTIEVVIPRMTTCPIPRNPFFQGNFKESFRKLLLKDSTSLAVKEEIMVYLEEIISEFSILSFSVDHLNKYSPDDLNQIYDIRENRILVSLIFWEYISHCANYDLNTRKYFYED
ncbi:hypothetical protein J0656_17170 [Muricauda ruestringensis]|uniref:Uncharacterized protein n=1 Tax=Flagellimonas aurea TaxID=2915619 RepID=A0ABS3GAZ3_9FLAO|nr:hypothetical protein [Allomuricauda aurea]MBO0355752.1 hypothetical protein [Allomuricauda aurea]